MIKWAPSIYVRHFTSYFLLHISFFVGIFRLLFLLFSFSFSFFCSLYFIRYVHHTVMATLFNCALVNRCEWILQIIRVHTTCRWHSSHIVYNNYNPHPRYWHHHRDSWILPLVCGRIIIRLLLIPLDFMGGRKSCICMIRTMVSI